jgi:hypothetical protein
VEAKLQPSDSSRKARSVAISVKPRDGERVGDRLGGRAYYDVIKQGIAGIGLDASKFGSHSMRSGWLSTAASNGARV